MKEPSEYLNLAKEKVANFHYGGMYKWDELFPDVKADLWDEVYIQALQLQQEDAEKEIESLKNGVETSGDLIEQLKAELSQSKSALAASERFRAEDAMSALNEANQLREKLSQEKAKAFDEGLQAQYDLMAYKKEVVNPYKQNTQPKQ